MDLKNCDWFSDASEKPSFGKNIGGEVVANLDWINQQNCLRFIWLLFNCILSTHWEILNRRLTTLQNDSVWLDEGFSPWRWRQHVPSKRRCQPTILPGVKPKGIIIWSIPAGRTWQLTPYVDWRAISSFRMRREKREPRSCNISSIEHANWGNLW